MRVCGIVFVLFSTRALMSYLIPRLSVWLASDAVMKMRRDLIDHLMTLDLAFFERTHSGDLILRLVSQAQGLSQFVGQATVNAVRDAATILIVSGYLIYKSPLLFTAALIILPTILLLLQHVSSTIKHIKTPLCPSNRCNSPPAARCQSTAPNYLNPNPNPNPNLNRHPHNLL